MPPTRHIQTPLLTILLFLFALPMAAQTISVHSFDLLERDLDARVHNRVYDQNGELCALIKVVTPHTGFEWEPDALGIVASIRKTGEYWLYVPRGARRITIKHDDLGILRNYEYPIAIRSGDVYEMVLTTGRIETTVIPPELESQWLLITVEPNTALIYLDDNFESTGILQKRLLPGTYNYRIENSLYHPEAGLLTVTPDERAELSVALSPNYGYIEVRSLPEAGARVQIDGNDAGFTTNGTSQRLRSGEYTVTVIKEQFRPASQQVTVRDNETTSVNLDMAPNFATVDVQIPDDAMLFINNDNRGTGSWSGRLSAGVYTFEARKESHRPARRDLQLQVGDLHSIELQPVPITGSLDVVTIPPQASITINGEDHGTTPTTIRNLLIGDYDVELSRAGHATVSEQVTIAEGETAEVNVELPAGMDEDLIKDTESKRVTINSKPTGAELYVNNRLIGTTPYNGVLEYGFYSLRLVKDSKETHEGILITQDGESSFEYVLLDCGKDVTFTYNGKRVTYGVIARGGLCWMDRNLGAGRVPISHDDPEGYGDLFQWGRGDDGHQKRNSGTTSIRSRSDTPRHGDFILCSRSPFDWHRQQNNGLWQGVNGINNPCPPGWRLPTDREWEAERRSWRSNNHEGAFASPLKLPVAGNRGYSSGSLGSVASFGLYWSSTVDGSYSRYLYFFSTGASTYSDTRALGYSVRCLKD